MIHQGRKEIITLYTFTVILNTSFTVSETRGSMFHLQSIPSRLITSRFSFIMPLLCVKLIPDPEEQSSDTISIT